jgi:hypothetical protein
MARAELLAGLAVRLPQVVDLPASRAEQGCYPH